MTTHPSRRGLGKMAVAAALGRTASSAVPALKPGIKLSLQVSTDPGPEELLFVKQMGVEYVNIPTGGARATCATFAELKRRVEAAGLKVWNIGNSNVHNMPEVTLNLPGRDRKIEEYKAYLRNLAKAGIFYTTYAHMGNGIWSTEPEVVRGARGRAFDLAKAKEGEWAGQRFPMPLSHGRKYSVEEIWENYAYFIRQVKPLAQELGIRIGIHPDDPPVPELAGVPRPIFSSFDGYRRALEMADSPNIGMCLCVGCWLEGGPAMGRDAVETIRYFGRRKLLFKVHFRNVNAPLPHFAETLLDNGYQDMYPVMRALREVDYDGCVIADHVPQIQGGYQAAAAYSIAYMRALIQRAEAG